MNSSHGLAAGAGGGFSAALLAAICQTWHLDPGLVGNWLIVAGGLATSVGAAAIVFIKWKWPQVPLDAIEHALEPESAEPAPSPEPPERSGPVAAAKIDYVATPPPPPPLDPLKGPDA